MADAEKSKEQLLEELQALRARVAELEHAAAERRRAANRSRWGANHDDLTGLFDRAHFLERLTVLIPSAQRYKYPVSICACCLDSIESLSETRGRDVADELLAGFGELVLDELRGEDVAGRCGENEFCICFPHTMAADAATAVQRVRRRLAGMVSGLPITATFGIADLSSGATTGRELLAVAEEALAKALDEGGDSVLLHEA